MAANLYAHSMNHVSDIDVQHSCRKPALKNSFTCIFYNPLSWNIRLIVNKTLYKMGNSSRIFQLLFYYFKKAAWQFIFILLIPVILISCTKEYSCENNCRMTQPVVKDTTNKDSIPVVKYKYFSSSYHVSLAGTGNNA